MFEVTIIYDEYAWIEGECKKVNLKKSGAYKTWDEVESLLGCYVNAFKKITVELSEKEATE